jgi:hypothetical protein
MIESLYYAYILRSRLILKNTREFKNNYVMHHLSSNHYASLKW